MSGDMMPKQQYDFIKGIQDNMLEASNMTEDDAWRFGFLIWQHQEWICKYLIDRKTEPSNSEIPNNCEHITEDGVTCAKYPACDVCLDNPLNKVKGSERLVKGSEQTEPTISKMEQVEEPQTDCYDCAHWDYQREVCCRGGGCEFQKIRADCPWK